MYLTQPNLRFDVSLANLKYLTRHQSKVIEMEQVNQAIYGSDEAIRHASLASKGIPPKSVISNPNFSGLYEEGHGGYYLWNVSDWKSFTHKWDEALPKIIYGS